MSYTLNKSDGTTLVTIADGASDSASSSLTFVGQNYVGYGEILQENLVKLLENFSRVSAPANPLVGQLWWDTSTNLLKVRVNGSTWRTLASSTAAAAAPSNANVGDFWFDTTKDQVKVWAGSNWIVVGPSYERGQDTIANAMVVTDDLTNSHTIMTFWVGGQIRSILNPDLDFTPASVISGFSTIKQGFNLSSTFAPASTTYHGTAQNAITLQSLSPTAFLRSGQNETIGGNLLINSDNGLWVGSGGKFRVTVDTLTGTTTLRSHTNGAGITLSGTFNNTPVNFITSDASTGLLTVSGNPTAQFGIATKNYVDTSITAVSSVLRSDIDSNVISINSTLGTLTTEINNLNTYAINLNSTKANIASAEFTGVPKAPTRGVTTSNTAIATTAFVHSVLPYGSIIMWSGSPGSVPTGWSLCDGTNSTPDLRNRFIIGAGDAYNHTSIGGSKDAVVVSHTHTATVSDPGHNHAVTDPGHTHSMIGVLSIANYVDGQLDGSYRQGSGQEKFPETRPTQSAVTGISVNSRTTGIGVNIATSGVSGTNANLPPYYALCFIMKVV